MTNLHFIHALLTSAVTIILLAADSNGYKFIYHGNNRMLLPPTRYGFHNAVFNSIMSRIPGSHGITITRHRAYVPRYRRNMSKSRRKTVTRRRFPLKTRRMKYCYDEYGSYRCNDYRERISYSRGSLFPRLNTLEEFSQDFFHFVGLSAQTETEEYGEVTQSSPLPLFDTSEDFDTFEISEYEDPVSKSYHCSVRTPNRNATLTPNPEFVKFLDNNSFFSVRPRKKNYQVRQVRQKMCQYGFSPFQLDLKSGSIHKRFKNTLRLMIYNTPGMFPGLKVIRNDLDRRRKREPQIWCKFEHTSGPLAAEFDYDNYFLTITGDFSRIKAFSKLLVALKMHKRLNNFNDNVSYKVNLDLGIAEMILTSFGMWMLRDKSIVPLMVNALNGIRTEITDKGDVQLEFEETLKEAADQVDPVLYSYIWLLSMAEKNEVVRIREKPRLGQDKLRNISSEETNQDLE